MDFLAKMKMSFFGMKLTTKIPEIALQTIYFGGGKKSFNWHAY